jgi:hypothetical protein
MAANHCNTRPGEAAGARTREAAAKMPAAKTGVRATEAAMTAAATTAVASRERASRHRGRADCYSPNERNNFIPHYTLLHFRPTRPEQQRSHDTLGCSRAAAPRPNDAECVTWR